MFIGRLLCASLTVLRACTHHRGGVVHLTEEAAWLWGLVPSPSSPGYRVAVSAFGSGLVASESTLLHHMVLKCAGLITIVLKLAVQPWKKSRPSPNLYPKTAVPNSFGTRAWFPGRTTVGEGWFQDNSSALHLSCPSFLSLLHQLHLRSQRLGIQPLWMFRKTRA